MTKKKIIASLIAIMFLGIAGVVAFVAILHSQLPPMISVADYQPLLVSEVYDRNGNKYGELAREKRTLVEYKDIPQVVIQAFLAAEDSSFFEHGGINYIAIARAMLANIRAGGKVQGASTITQQVARSLLLTNEKTYTRKIKEILLAFRMEANLKKEDILYLYLNQIFLGQNAYGIAQATDIYYNKQLKDINLKEAAILAGLPKAPSQYNPVRDPRAAKDRQRYVLNRMADEKFITDEEAAKAAEEPVNIYMKKNYWELAPHYLETVRQMLIEKLGEEVVLDKGIKIYTALDLPKQMEAQKALQNGLRGHDKRQGYRGPTENTEDVNRIAEILVKSRDEYLDKENPFKIMLPDGTFTPYEPLNLSGFVKQKEGDTAPPQKLPALPAYLKVGDIIDAIVTKVDDEWGLTYVRFAESVGLIDIETMKWARVPDPNIDSRYAEEVKKPSKVLKKGDVIKIKILDDEFTSTRITEELNERKKRLKKKYTPPVTLPEFKDYAAVELEQVPLAEGAILSIDQRTDDLVTMVGGYNFNKSQLNRALQAARQTGSSFKTLVYAAALDKGYTPATPILDAPIVYEEEQEVAGSDNAETVTKRWKPTNHSNKFEGDILFRNALIHSLNVPTVKIIEKIGVEYSADYARRLGIFSSLNLDFTLALGSSSVTLYEMTKAFAQIGRLGKRARPLIVSKVLDKDGKEIHGKVFIDDRFEAQIKPIEESYERRRKNYLAYQNAIENNLPYEKPAPTDDDPTPRDPAKEPQLFFKDPDQLIRPETAYVITTLLQGVVDEAGGTGAAARALGRPVAGKTGTTNQYYDAWFIGYTTQYATGVWMGHDQEQTLGKNEVGGRTALPIWLDFMKFAHGDSPARDFSTPDNIVYASIDNETGKLASSNSKEVVKQAFIEGTEPQDQQDEGKSNSEQQQDFYKEDLAE